MPKKPLLLMILDGWGINPNRDQNAVALAKTPNLTGFLHDYPHTRILSSGMAVGLPDGQMGNSEVGHLNLGAGRAAAQAAAASAPWHWAAASSDRRRRWHARWAGSPRWCRGASP